MAHFWTKLLKPSGWIAKLLVVLFVALFFSLGYSEKLEPIKALLDSKALSLELGDVSVSVYMVVKGLLVTIILFWLTGIVSEFGETRIRRIRGIKTSNKALIIKVFQIGVYFLAFIFILDLMGIDLTTLAIFSGAVGIGIGFGLQKITSNFISGLILLFEKSVEENDLVEMGDGTAGFVRHTGARYTLIEDFDGKEVMVPNEDFITGRVTNWTFSNTKGRIDIDLGVSYDCDIELARNLILEAAKEHPRCSIDPEPKCFLREFADSSVNFLLYMWVDDVTEGRYEPKSDVMRAIWRKFKENNIAIPYPQRDLHIVSDQRPQK